MKKRISVLSTVVLSLLVLVMTACSSGPTYSVVSLANATVLSDFSSINSAEVFSNDFINATLTVKASVSIVSISFTGSMQATNLTSTTEQSEMYLRLYRKETVDVGGVRTPTDVNYMEAYLIKNLDTNKYDGAFKLTDFSMAGQKVLTGNGDGARIDSFAFDTTTVLSSNILQAMKLWDSATNKLSTAFISKAEKATKSGKTYYRLTMTPANADSFLTSNYGLSASSLGSIESFSIAYIIETISGVDYLSGINLQAKIPVGTMKATLDIGLSFSNVSPTITAPAFATALLP